MVILTIGHKTYIPINKQLVTDFHKNHDMHTLHTTTTHYTTHPPIPRPHTHTHTHVHTCMHVHTHTHTHTHTNSPMTFIPLLFISLARLVTIDLICFCPKPTYGIICTGKEYGFCFLLSGLINTAKMCVAAVLL